MRVLLDTNVILGLLCPRSEVFRRIDEAWRGGAVEVVLSHDLLLELARAAAYPKLMRLRGLPAEKLAPRLWSLARQAQIEIVQPIAPYPGLRHPNDPGSFHCLGSPWARE